MSTRSLERSIELSAGQNRVFDLFITPSDVRQWWGAHRVIITPKTGGVWAAAWGDDEDSPEYVSAHRIVQYDPPHELVLSTIDYYARSGKLPFEAQLGTTFTVEASGDTTTLHVRQEGFPAEAVADEFFKACDEGWSRTLDQIRDYLRSH